MITEQQLIEMHDEMLDDISLAEYADSLMEDGEEVEGY